MKLSTQLSQIGRNIRTARENAGLSLEQLSEKTAVIPTRLLEFEASDALPSLEQLETVADALHIPLRQLLDTEQDAVCPDKEDKPRVRTCRYAFPMMDGTVKCKNSNVTGHDAADGPTCETCPCYDSLYIQYPLEINGINISPLEGWNLNSVGQPVAVRPCSENPENRTYLGMYLGEQPWFLSASFHRDTRRLDVSAACNPMIYIFETRRIVRGADSWWSRIRSLEDMPQISDEDISSTWYVQLMNALMKPDGED